MKDTHKEALHNFYNTLVSDCEAFNKKTDYSEWAFDSPEVLAAFDRLADLIQEMVSKEQQELELKHKRNEEAIELEWKRTRGV